MGALFFVAAGLQYNDPDPVRWMLVYAAAGVVTVLVTAGRNVSRIPVLMVGIVAAAWGLLIARGGAGIASYLHMFASWEMRSASVEEAREASGLLIVAAWMALIAASPACLAISVSRSTNDN